MCHFVIVFSEDRVIEAARVEYQGKQYSYNDYSLSAEIPSGEYCVVNCEVGHVGYYIAITKVESRKATFSEAVQFRDLCFLHESIPNKILANLIPTSDLTGHQCKAIIKTIQEMGFGPWWDNAPKEVKAALGATFAKEDEARDLMHQGTQLASQRKFHEAKALIMKSLTMYPEMRGARRHLGRISIELGCISEAIKWFTEELNLAKDSKDLSACLYLSAIYQALGDMEQADAYSQAAMATEAYKRTPGVALAPDVIQKIWLASSMREKSE